MRPAMSDATAPGIWRPNWPLPSNVKCVLTHRAGGVSKVPYDSFNLAEHVGDDPQAVAANRSRLSDYLHGRPVRWLKQVHGNDLIQTSSEDDFNRVPEADACFSQSPGVVCAVMTADCLPILVCDEAGTTVAAIHAGWRGLANGIIARSLQQLPVPAESLSAFLGPAISQQHYEVGIEVVEALYDSTPNVASAEAIGQALKPGHRPLHFYLDLFHIARAQLQSAGVRRLFGGDLCTYSDPRLFSHRQSNPTGRQASLIWLD